MNISPELLYVGQVSGIDGFNLFVLQPPETSPTKADQFNWFVVGPISSWKSVPTGYELSQLNVSFAALLCAEFIPRPRYEKERNLEPSFASLYSSVHELITSRRLLLYMYVRPVKGKC
jgi:hypothetical protein